MERRHGLDAFAYLHDAAAQWGAESEARAAAGASTPSTAEPPDASLTPSPAPAGPAVERPMRPFQRLTRLLFALRTS